MTTIQNRPEPIAVGEASRPRFDSRSILHGVIAASAMGLFYVVVVRAASGSWIHLANQARQDWYYLVAIVFGFGTQVALVSELRHRRRFDKHAILAGGAGAGASTAGMVACCAHHLADLFPIIGAASAAGFMTDYRIPFMLVGIAINAVAVILVARQLRRTTSHDHGALT